MHSLGAKTKLSLAVPNLCPQKRTTKNPILMGTTLSATTGATTASPPTEDVTDTAGVRIPSEMVKAVANSVYRKV